MRRRRAELARPRTFRRDGHGDPVGPPSARTLGELESYASLAAAVAFQTWYDAGVPERAVGAVAWVLAPDGARRSLWAEWAPTLRTRRFRVAVVERAAQIIATGNGPHPQARAASPRVRRILREVLRRHLTERELAAVVARAPAAPPSRQPVAADAEDDG